MKYSMKELDHAIKWAFNFEPHVDAMFGHLSRPTVHKLACQEAFIFNLRGPNVDILRQALKDLNYEGQYRPSVTKLSGE